jgi:putative ABC transport system permease protein
MDFYLQTLLLALALSPMCLGIFITLRIFNFPDITTDGSYTLGAALTAILIFNDISPLVAMLSGVVGGIIAGLLTGWINTRLKVNPLLAGILVMTALYSINLFIMGRSNIPLIQKTTILDSSSQTLSTLHTSLLIYGIIALTILTLLFLLLMTDYGIAMRATGNNEKMVSAYGANPSALKVAGLSLANGLTALSGALAAQMQAYADINMGIGIVIFGLGAAMIGESISNFAAKNGLIFRLLAVLLGCIIFRLIIAFAIASGLDPLWMKAVTALFVLIFVALPFKQRFKFKN